jgi:hypothetical protein
MQTEDAFQSSCYQWFHATYPQYRGLLCYNLNNPKNKIRGIMDKGMGLQRGRSDMVLYFDRKAYHIELKVAGGTQKPDSKEVAEIIQNAGFSYVIIKDNLQDFEDYINGIIK